MQIPRDHRHGQVSPEALRVAMAKAETLEHDIKLEVLSQSVQVKVS